MDCILQAKKREGLICRILQNRNRTDSNGFGNDLILRICGARGGFQQLFPLHSFLPVPPSITFRFGKMEITLQNWYHWWTNLLESHHLSYVRYILFTLQRISLLAKTWYQFGIVVSILKNLEVRTGEGLGRQYLIVGICKK